MKKTHNITKLITSAALFCGGLTGAQASIVLYNTGVNNVGATLGLGEADLHWSIFYGPGITEPVSPVTLLEQSPFGLYANSPNSLWIWANDAGTGAVDEFYGFQLSFEISSIEEAASLNLSGDWSVDNEGHILLNGAAATGTGALALSSGGHGAFHPFNITGGFVVGTNVLEFSVVDRGVPGGFNVTNLTANNVVPEPTTTALVLGCAVALIATYRRGKNKR